MATDPLIWANQHRMNLRSGVKFSLKGMPYLSELVTNKKRIINCKKGAQVCATTTLYLDDVHACYYNRYDQNIMYMMPTVTAVERLSKTAFDPIFTHNPWLIQKGATNTTMCKEINGRSIVMVGAQPKKVAGSSVKDSDNLRSIACDRIDRDELDMHDPDMVYQSKQRLKRSKFGHERNFGSPTYPGYGIDALYEGSDQGKWQIKCRHCGKYTCLVESFPDSIIQIEGVWTRACIHCHKEIYVVDGSWQTDFPDRREAGLWIDGLISPYADLEEYMYQYNTVEGAHMAEFLRSTLGIATVEAENQLDDVTVRSRCSSDRNQLVCSGETAMGVDIGKKIHATIGIRSSRDTYDILHVSRMDNLNELHDLALKMNVRYGVIDSGPYDHGVREFQKSEPYTISLCQYSEQMPGKPIFDAKSGMVKCNRNEWMDAVHASFINNKIRIPRSSLEVEEYIDEMTRTAKTVITNPDTGTKKPRWIKLGADHYYHSTLYFMLAASRTSPRHRNENRINRPTHSLNKWK